MPPQQRERYNSRARNSTAGGSSHKKRSRGAQSGPMSGVLGVEDGHDDSMDIIVPKTQQEKEEDRKRKLKEEMMAASETKMSSKKKKRLEGFIDKKLKKEARLELFAKLQDAQAAMPSHLLGNLASSSTLGSGSLMSHTAKLAKEEDKNVRRMLARKGGKRRRLDLDGDDEGSESDEEEDWETGKGGELKPRPVPKEDEPEERSAFSGVAGVEVQGVKKPVEVGGALKKREDGGIAQPKFVPLKTNKGKGKVLSFGGWKDADAASHFPTGYEDDSEDSFDSSDSDNDSDGEDDMEEGMSEDDDGESMSDGVDGSEEDEDEDSDEEEDESEEDETPKGKRKRAGGFKAWALNQIETVYKGDEVKKATGDEPMADATTTPSATAPTADSTTKVYKVPRQTEKVGPLGVPLLIPSTSLITPSSASDAPKAGGKNRVFVERDPAIQEKRLLLPVVAEEQPIVETILMNPVTVLCGETGSGKTTQVPQFLFEAGFGTPGSDNPGMIGITQPRRVAAMSMASRVASELALPPSRVSYQIRYDATVSPQTSIKFMTDGVLLRELARDFLLTKYSVVIVDEAHERSVNTDVLIGVLSRVSKLREELWRKGKDGVKPLRIVIMSATLRVTDFSENKTLFPSPPPVITISTRQHPVTIHFNRRTPTDYLGEAFKKVSKIHVRLPPGGVLVFLTGQGEIQSLCRKLEKKFGKKAIEERQKRRQKERERVGGWRSEMGKDKEEDDKADSKKEDDMKVVANDADIEIEELEFGQDEPGLADDVDDGADSDPEALDSDSDSEGDDEITMEEESEAPIYVLPLYSLLPSDKQMRVFAEPPAGSRLVVVATNVAETSLTIPGIKYVVDCGRAKERHYDAASGVQTFQVSWVSKASASQRAGRAGRTGPGHCYRLYSSPVFENYFEKFAQPEILRMPIEGIVLQMKSMNIDAVINFPFPTPPDRSALMKAEKILGMLGALEQAQKGKMVNGVVRQGIVGGRITELGRAMSLFPVSPRYSKMLVSGQQHGCLPYVIAAVAVLAVGDPFLREEALGREDDDQGEEEDDNVELKGATALIRSDALRAKEECRLKRKAFFQSQAIYSALGNGASDVFRLIAVVGAYEYDGTGDRFCAKNYVRPKAMQEIHKLRAQMSSIAQSVLPAQPTPNKGKGKGKNPSTEEPLFNPKLAPPSTTQLKILRQLITSAFIDQIAVRKDLIDPEHASAGGPGGGKGAGGGRKWQNSRGVAYRAMGVEEDVYIHPGSGMFSKEPEEWVVFGEVTRGSKVWIKNITKLNPSWLPSLAPSHLLTFSKPLSSPATSSLTAQKLTGKEGEERETFVIPRFSLEGFNGASGKGIELPVVKRKEVWQAGKGWVMTGK